MQYVRERGAIPRRCDVAKPSGDEVVNPMRGIWLYAYIVPATPDSVKKIGFLSFGHWSASPHSVTRSARDVLQQSIELAVAAKELGADGAYFRVLMRC